MKTFRIVSVLAIFTAGLFHTYAQDVITLKSGEEIKVKVTEISATEIKYKQFENLNGPTVVIEKAKVFAINYENGTREIINVITEEPAAKPEPTRVQETKPAESYQDKNRRAKPNIGIYVDPVVGFLTFGPMIGAEFSAGMFDLKLNFRFPSMGLLMPWMDDWEYGYDCNIDRGIGIGIAPTFYTNRVKGGFYAGGLIEYGTYRAVYSDGHGESAGVAVGANVGYKFVLPFGLYFRAGGYLGAYVNAKYDWYPKYSIYPRSSSGDVTIFGMLDLAIGFKFLKVKR